MRFSLGFGVGVNWRCDNHVNRRWTALVMMAFGIVNYPRSWFRDRPSVTGTRMSHRMDSPSPTGAWKDRIGE